MRKRLDQRFIIFIFLLLSLHGSRACESINLQDLTKQETEAACHEKSSLGCRFVQNPSRRRDFKCLTLVDENNRTDCGKISELFGQKDIRNSCKKEDHCTFDLSGRNKKGLCFEIAGCDDVNKFGISSKVKRFCSRKDLNGGFDCSFSRNTCMDLAL